MLFCASVAHTYVWYYARLFIIMLQITVIIQIFTASYYHTTKFIVYAYYTIILPC